MKKYLLTLLTTTGLAISAQAATVSIPLAGNTTTEQWTNITSTNHPGYGSFPGSGAWPSPIASDVSASSSGDSTLNKVANGAGGGPYPATEGIYHGGFSPNPNVNGGTLSVGDATPLAGLQSVVFQIEIGEAFTYDFFNEALPTLSYTTSLGTFALDNSYRTSSLFDKEFTGTVEMPTGPGGTMQEEDLFTNTYALLFDLSEIEDPITSFNVEWSSVQHSSIYSLQLDQSDAFNSSAVLPAAVPEPTGLSLALAGGLLFLARRRTNRR